MQMALSISLEVEAWDLWCLCKLMHYGWRVFSKYKSLIWCAANAWHTNLGSLMLFWNQIILKILGNNQFISFSPPQLMSSRRHHESLALAWKERDYMWIPERTLFMKFVPQNDIESYKKYIFEIPIYLHYDVLEQWELMVVEVPYLTSSFVQK